MGSTAWLGRHVMAEVIALVCMGVVCNNIMRNMTCALWCRLQRCWGDKSAGVNFNCYH